MTFVSLNNCKSCPVLQAAQVDAARKEMGELKNIVSENFKSCQGDAGDHDVTSSINSEIMIVVQRPNISSHLVGLQDKVQGVMQQLEQMEGNVLGVVGMGGIGKLITIYIESVLHSFKRRALFSRTWCSTCFQRLPEVKL